MWGQVSHKTTLTNSQDPMRLFFLLLCLLLSVASCPYDCSCFSQGNNKYVDCTSRNLRSIPPGIDHDVTNLLLANNFLQTLGPSPFYNLKYLEVLDLENNSIKYLEEDAFIGLARLEELRLNKNSIKNLPPRIFDNLYKLKDLILSNNRITTLEKSIFDHCDSLKLLDISNTNLTREVFEVINRVPQLLYLYLENNDILDLPYLMLHNLNDLIELDLKKNKVRMIDPNAFVGLTSLKKLDVSDNKLTELRRETFQPLSMYLRLDLSGNPFMECNCGVKQTQDWLIESSSSFTETAYCTDPFGDELDIEFYNFKYFCNENYTVPPSPLPTKPDVLPENCTSNSMIKLHLIKREDDAALLTWNTTGIKQYSYPVVTFREIGKSDKELFPESHFIRLGNLEPDLTYIVCVFESVCHSRSCLDLIPDSHDNNTPKTCKSGGIDYFVFFIIFIALLVCLAALIIVLISKLKKKEGIRNCFDHAEKGEQSTAPEQGSLSQNNHHGKNTTMNGVPRQMSRPIVTTTFV